MIAGVLALCNEDRKFEVKVVVVECRHCGKRGVFQVVTKGKAENQPLYICLRCGRPS